MKRILTILFFGLIFISCCYADNVIETKTDINFYEYFFSNMSWKTTAALNEYSNFKTSVCFEKSFFETEFYSIATITSADKKTRVSANMFN